MDREGHPQRAATRGLALAAIVALAGCGIFDFGRMPLVPGSRWDVAAVDDQAVVNNDLLLVVEPDGEHASLSGDCGSALFQVVYDTDGRALHFLVVPEPQDMPHGCAEDDLMQEALVAGALQTSERWDTDGSAVLVNGDQSVRLEPSGN